MKADVFISTCANFHPDPMKNNGGKANQSDTDGNDISVGRAGATPGRRRRVHAALPTRGKKGMFDRSG